MHTRRALLGLMLSVFTVGVPDVAAQGVNVKYAVLIVIDASDSVPTLRATIGGMLARLSGRDEEPGEPGNFNRFVLADTDPERDVRIFLGFESLAGPNLLELAEALPGPITETFEFASPITRTEMLRRLRLITSQRGYTHAWDLRAASRTDGLLVRNFTPIVP